MMDLVSVIVPIYNAEKYLGECIESILNQTYTKVELVLVNDGSIDKSLEICKHYEVMDKRIKIVNKPNSGVSDSRNIGIDHSTGKYICFVDADDKIVENYVEILLNEISTNNVDVVFCNYQYMYGDKLIKKKPRLPFGKYSVDELKKFLIDDGTMSGILFGSVWGAIYKSEIIEPFA